MSQEQGTKHVQVLKGYLAGLKAEREGLPGRAGKVNVSAVATACGFNREVLYQNPTCRKMLDDAAEDLGLRGVKVREGAGDHEMVKLERRLTHLEQQNSALVAEVHELRRQLRAFGHIEDMLEAGRRVIA